MFEREAPAKKSFVFKWYQKRKSRLKLLELFIKWKKKRNWGKRGPQVNDTLWVIWRSFLSIFWPQTYSSTPGWSSFWAWWSLSRYSWEISVSAKVVPVTSWRPSTFTEGGLPIPGSYVFQSTTYTIQACFPALFSVTSNIWNLKNIWACRDFLTCHHNWDNIQSQKKAALCSSKFRFHHLTCLSYCRAWVLLMKGRSLRNTQRCYLKPFEVPHISLSLAGHFIIYP